MVEFLGPLTPTYGVASTIEYTTPLACIGVSESDSKLFTNFEFCEGENYTHLENTLMYKAKQFMLTNYLTRKVDIFEKMVQVGTLNTQLSKIYLKYNKIH
jgi:hypothetical protein